MKILTSNTLKPLIVILLKKNKIYFNKYQKKIYNYYKRVWLLIYYNYLQKFCFKLLFFKKYLYIYYLKTKNFNLKYSWIFFKNLLKTAKYTILLKGLGYKIFQKKNKFIKMRLGLSHFIFFKIPKKIKIFFCTDYRFKIKSIQHLFLFDFVKFFISFRLPLRYKYLGLYIKNKPFKIYPGKIKKI